VVKDLYHTDEVSHSILIYCIVYIAVCITISLHGVQLLVARGLMQTATTDLRLCLNVLGSTWFELHQT